MAFIGASAADDYGNCTSQIGPNACGSMGYSFVDAHNAGCVVVVTDNLVDYPCCPVSISQQYVDYVVKVDSIGDPAKIGAGAARLTKNPRDLMIAQRTVNVMAASRRFKDGFSFQTGAGAISIATTKYLAERMKERGVKASFALGGIPAAIIDMYDEGLVRVVACSQSFDAVAAQAISSRPGVIEIDNADYANAYSKGGYLNREDFGILGALEVDTDFNVNILTGSSGEMRGGLGGRPRRGRGRPGVHRHHPRDPWPHPLHREEGVHHLHPRRDRCRGGDRGGHRPEPQAQELSGAEGGPGGRRFEAGDHRGASAAGRVHDRRPQAHRDRRQSGLHGGIPGRQRGRRDPPDQKVIIPQEQSWNMDE